MNIRYCQKLKSVHAEIGSMNEPGLLFNVFNRYQVVVALHLSVF